MRQDFNFENLDEKRERKQPSSDSFINSFPDNNGPPFSFFRDLPQQWLTRRRFFRDTTSIRLEQFVRYTLGFGLEFRRSIHSFIENYHSGFFKICDKAANGQSVVRYGKVTNCDELE